MTHNEYKQAIAEVFQIEAVLLSTTTGRKNTRLIVRHMRLCSQIRAYERALYGGAGRAA